MISAKIIADSKNESGNRITSFVLVFPRIVLAEFNTHRALSRNSASSRAIPFEKMLKMVEDNPFVPVMWMKDHKGMQGDQFFTTKDPAKAGHAFDNAVEELNNEWWRAREKAITEAKKLSELGLTKQIVNRLLEPFMWHTVIATATEWENFIALRAHAAAEIHIQELASQMLYALNNSEPKLLKAGEWHIPFGDNIDDNRIHNMIAEEFHRNPLTYGNLLPGMINERKVKIATARCARVSYMNFEGKDDYEADIKLHDQLLSSGHMSPFEHCAKPGVSLLIDKGNFKGFAQYRKFIDGENKSEPRLLKK